MELRQKKAYPKMMLYGSPKQNFTASISQSGSWLPDLPHWTGCLCDSTNIGNLSKSMASKGLMASRGN